jgi:hypothetical protein
MFKPFEALAMAARRGEFTKRPLAGVADVLELALNIVAAGEGEARI